MTRINKLIMTKFVEGKAFLLLFTAISFTACERDFPNLNAPIVDDVPIQSLVTGAEAGMRVDLAIYLRVVSVVGREAYYFEPADPRYSGDLLRGVPDPGGFLVERPWRARYRTIANCNALLDKSQEAGVQGFAKTILAYQFLLNLNYLDENGIQLDLSGNLTPFATKTEALTRIAALLDEANTSLAAAGSGFSFNLTSGFAGFDTPSGFRQFNRALKSRVSVYRGMFNEAQTALGESFMSAGASLDLGVYHIYGTGLADQGNEIFENPSASFVKFLAHPTFGTNAEAGDMRFSSKTFLRADATTFDNLTSNLAVTVTSNSTDALPIIRNEELILLSAEAKIGLGDYSGAEMDMNIIRTAAGLPGYNGTDATNAVDRLLHERRYSLFLEGHRWVDVRRYGRLNQLPIDRPTDVALDKMPVPEDEVGG